MSTRSGEPPSAEQRARIGRLMVACLYSLTRSSRLYAPENAVFERPLLQLQRAIGAALRSLGQLELVVVQETFHLNNEPVRTDRSAVEQVRSVIGELRARHLAGFAADAEPSVEELRNLVALLASEPAQFCGERGLEGRPLRALRVIPWTAWLESVRGGGDVQDLGSAESKEASRKALMGTYAQVLYYCGRYQASLGAGAPLPRTPAVGLVQELVEHSRTFQEPFFQLCRLRDDDHYLVLHQVNVCLLALAFGRALGLTTVQLRELGAIALFHSAGMAALPATVVGKAGALTSEERRMVDFVPLLSAWKMLEESQADAARLLGMVTVLEHKGALRGSTAPGLFARIVTLCDAYESFTAARPFRPALSPEQAITAMARDASGRYDLRLLPAFMHLVRVPSVRLAAAVASTSSP